MMGIEAGRQMAVLAFVEDAAAGRAASYRERGEHLAAIAAREINPDLRRKLIELADQYKKLAVSVEIARLS